jgi:putative transposase
MGKRSVEITVTPRQRVILKRVTRSKKAAQQLVERCRVVLLSATGMHNEAQGDELGVDRQRVRRWRHRWARAMASLQAAEAAGASDQDLEKLIIGVLTDVVRSGAPPRFSAEQVAGIIALACELPADSGLPVSHWTPSELAREAAKRGIVESISPRQVDRFLAMRPCDRTRASTGSPRRTSAKPPLNTKPTSNDCVTPTATRRSLPLKARTL